MIRLLSPGESLCCPDPLTGCRIETLADCYGSMANELKADCYRSGEGGVLCHWGDRLLLSGRCDPNELWDFALMLGAARIEGLPAAARLPDGWQLEQHPALIHAPAVSVSGERPPAVPADRLRRVFALLCEADPAFAAESDLLHWLSDLTRRRNRGRAEVFLLEDRATACLSAIGGGYAYLSMVAAAPGARGQGLGGRLLYAVLQDCSRRKLSVVTAARDSALVPFYLRAGFRPLKSPLLIATRSRRAAAGGADDKESD